ncbi:hypothetical protein [Luteolibacter soli]|uniref:DEK C-terminal domain-containing protein n=1 Tax=Luteolibacter soli TaxID=3135280 RepID=A0ABU9AUT5_9BACT
MPPPEIPHHLTTQIDHHLSRSEVLSAISFLRETTGCNIADAKEAIGTRLRERFPDQFSSYRNLGDEDHAP